MEFFEYQPLPASIQEEVLKKAREEGRRT